MTRSTAFITVLILLLSQSALSADLVHPGIIKGIVIDADTAQPIPGAYVGVGWFGDSGGSNRSRHREMGWFAKDTTADDGRFELDGLIFTDQKSRTKYHPLIVTHQDYVRHDRNIELLHDAGVPDVKISLRRAAKIKVTTHDSDGNIQKGHWFFRLEALDGRTFLPPERDPHLDSFASSSWKHFSVISRPSVDSDHSFTCNGRQDSKHLSIT